MLPEPAIQEVLQVLLKYSGLKSEVDYSVSSGDSSKSPEKSLIRSLDAEIKQTEDLFKLCQGALHLKIASLRRQRNSLLPIYRLPQEILTDILIEVQYITEGNQDWPYMSLKQLAEVSSFWFSTVLSTPYLWTLVHTGCHPTFIKSIISRSKGMQLHLSCQDSLDHRQERKFLPLVITQTHRWKSFHNCPEHMMQKLEKVIMEESLPLLETFEAAPSSAPCSMPRIIFPHAPRLHTLLVPSYTLPWDDPILLRLRRLKFTPMSNGDELSSDQWKTLLSNCPQLEYLHAVGPVGSSQEQIDPFHVVLPSLKELTLEMLPADTVGILISSICPASEQIHIEIREPIYVRVGHVDEPFPNSSHPNSILSIIRSMTWMSATVLAGRIRGNPLLTYKTPTFNVPPSAAFNALIRSYDHQMLESLVIDGLPLLLTDTLSRTLECLHQLKKFEVTLPSESWANVYRDHLAGVCSVLSSKAETGWALPQLRHLVIRAEQDFGSVVQLIEARYGAGVSERSNLPQPLDVLELHPLNGKLIDSELKERLQAVLSEWGTTLTILPSSTTELLCNSP